VPRARLWIVRQIVLALLDGLSNTDNMSDSTLTWQLVDETAAKLEATEAARLKWRQRENGVPAIWRIRIAEALKAEGVQIELSAFDALPMKPGRIAA
jgi:hypothetical protein